MIQRSNHDAYPDSGSTIRISKRKRENDAVIEELYCLDLEAKKRRVLPPSFMPRISMSHSVMTFLIPRVKMNGCSDLFEPKTFPSSGLSDVAHGNMIAVGDTWSVTNLLVVNLDATDES